MKTIGKRIQNLVLFTMLLLIVPLIVFPKKVGLGLTDFTLIYIGYELVFYGVVFFLFNFRTSLFKLFLNMIGCLAYRLAVGMLFGLVIIALYQLDASVAFTLSTFGYLPAVLFHVAVAPFVFRPLLKSDSRQSRYNRTRSDFLPPLPKPASSSTVLSKARGFGTPHETEKRIFPSEQRRKAPLRAAVLHAEKSMTGLAPETNGFDKATQYIGEVSSVYLAAVVDNEGLLLSRFTRAKIDAEEWAPYSLLYFDKAHQTLSKNGLNMPEKIDLFFEDKRIIMARDHHVCLMIVSERQADDLLSIRVSQGMDIIRKNIADRYDGQLSAKLEKSYV